MVIAPGVIVRWPSNPPVRTGDPEFSDAGETALATDLVDAEVR